LKFLVNFENSIFRSVSKKVFEILDNLPTNADIDLEPRQFKAASLKGRLSSLLPSQENVNRRQLIRGKWDMM
jgi:hypothetical protein